MSNQYNPNKHHRQSIRLRGWDYTTLGAYFITICTYQRENLFEDDTLRALAENAWQNIPTQPHAQHVALDEWVVMPNHLHGILVLIEIDNVETRHPRGGEASRKGRLGANNLCFDLPRPYKISSIRDASPLPDQTSSLPFDGPPKLPHGVESGSVGAIVGNFKSLVTRRVNNIRRTPGAKFWQRGYYDRIVRNERELNAIRRYIRDNPQRWQEDRENLDALLAKMRLVTS